MSSDGTGGEKRHRRDWVESGEPPPRDGRAARAVRTRRAVAEALLGLIEDGNLRPTSKCIAERAGVSERTIFQHFEDLETLFGVAADLIGESIVRNQGFVSDQGPLDDRLSAYLEQVLFIHESMTPTRRASRLHEPFSQEIDDALGALRSEMRRGIERVFAIELARWSDEALRRDAIESMALILTWSSWENMRKNSGFSRERALGVIELGIRAVLAYAPAPGEDSTPGSLPD